MVERLPTIGLQKDLRPLGRVKHPGIRSPANRVIPIGDVERIQGLESGFEMLSTGAATRGCCLPGASNLGKAPHVVMRALPRATVAFSPPEPLLRPIFYRAFASESRFSGTLLPDRRHASCMQGQFRKHGSQRLAFHGHEA